MVVVVPTCRSVNLDHLRPLIEFGARFIVIDDSAGSIRLDHPQFTVYSWRDHRRLLGSNDIAIPRRNGACRALGFLMAWRECDSTDTVIALDDDCVVDSQQFPQDVLENLGPVTRRLAAGAGRHMNIFDVADGLDSATLFPRGFPYSQRLSYAPWTFDEHFQGDVRFNLGLWRGVLDINAIDRLRMAGNHFPDIALRHTSVILPRGSLASLCAGNMHLRVELVPALYQLPMNVALMPEGPIDRHGDIWGGFILKRLMDIRGHCLSVGGPLVTHEREGPYLLNAVKEHLASLIHEEFIDLIWRSTDDVAAGDYLGMMGQFHDNLRSHESEASPILKSYLGHLLPTLGAWLRALQAR